jgi:acyl carrier protein
VRDALADELAAAGVPPSSVDDGFDLHGRGIIDSFGVLELIGDVEEHFGIEVDFEAMDPEQLTVVGPFSRYVAAAGARAGTPDPA